MAKCSFCGRQMETGTGMTLIKNDGKILRFDSRKCERSMVAFGRDSRHIRWVSRMKQKNRETAKHR